MDKKAYRVICMTLLILICHEVINLETSKEVWDALKEKYYVIMDI